MKQLSFFIVFLLLGSNIIQAQNIEWMTLAQAIEAQKIEPKKIFMDVYTNWCGPCKLLDKNTFQNPDVSRYISEHFYAVKFNAEGQEENAQRTSGSDFPMLQFGLLRGRKRPYGD